MNLQINESKDPAGWVVSYTDDSLKFKTFRYILSIDSKFVYVNPFGNALACPEYESFDEALLQCTTRVKEQLAKRK